MKSCCRVKAHDTHRQIYQLALAESIRKTTTHITATQTVFRQSLRGSSSQQEKIHLWSRTVWKERLKVMMHELWSCDRIIKEKKSINSISYWQINNRKSFFLNCEVNPWGGESFRIKILTYFNALANATSILDVCCFLPGIWLSRRSQCCQSWRHPCEGWSSPAGTHCSTGSS